MIMQILVTLKGDFNKLNITHIRSSKYDFYVISYLQFTYLIMKKLNIFTTIE